MKNDVKVVKEPGEFAPPYIGCEVRIRRGDEYALASDAKGRHASDGRRDTRLGSDASTDVTRAGFWFGRTSDESPARTRGGS